MDGYEHSTLYKQDKWDGWITFFDKNKQTFPAGFREMVIDEFNELGIQTELFRESSFKQQIPFSDETSKRPYQVNAILKFFKEKHCILMVPTRGGKTFIAGEIIRHLMHNNNNFQTLMFVDSVDLFNQARRDISNQLNINVDDIGEIRGDKYTIKPITVCMIQTITSILSGTKRTQNNDLEKISARNNKRKLLISFMKKVNFLIVDECHEYSSKPRLACLRKFSSTAEFKLYISASPFKSQSVLDNMNLMSVSGPLGYVIHESELKEQGFLAKDKVVLLYIDHDLNKNVFIDDSTTYKEVSKLTITHNHFRNSTMINCVEILRRLHIKTLVLFSIKEHGYWVKSINDVPFVSGETASKDREFIKNAFLKKNGGVLMASDIFKKGITLPEVQVLFNVAGGLEQSLITQRKGRVLGVTEEKKKALIIDFIDHGKYFSEHSLSRMDVYEKSVGSENIVILDTDDNDFYDMFKTIIKEWFEIPEE